MANEKFKLGVTRTRDEAMRFRNQLSTNTEFQKLVADGDFDALKLVAELTRQMVGEPDNWSPVPKGFGRHRDERNEHMVEYT